MTALDLEAIRKRAAAATPGPWTAGRPDMATIVDGIDSKWIYAGDQYCAVASGRIQGEWSEVMANAEFIAASRTDVPALCDEAEQRRADNAKLREVAEKVKADFPPYREVELVDDFPNDVAKEVPTGELLCGICACGLDEHDQDCLYALADLALRGGA